MAGEAEVDEPLPIEGAGHRLQNPDAPLAVLDELIVGRQDARDAALDREGRNKEIKRQELFQAQIVLGCSVRNVLHPEFQDFRWIRPDEFRLEWLGRRPFKRRQGCNEIQR